MSTSEPLLPKRNDVASDSETEHHVYHTFHMDAVAGNRRPNLTNNGTSSTAVFPISDNQTRPSSKWITNNGVFPTWNIIAYYLPCFLWISDYSWFKFGCDLVAGISLASFQIPLSLSYATSLAHVEPLSGIYSLAITPFVYAIFGSVPTMIVGPESAISLVIGQVVEAMTSHDGDILTSNVTTVVTFISGLILLITGILRLGFLGSILSRALLRGFICSIGLVMILNSLISELKLDKLLINVPEHYHTPFQKIQFVCKYGPQNYHKPTAMLSLLGFGILMTSRFFKRRLMRRVKWVVFFPEILCTVGLIIGLSYYADFKHSYGIATVGDFDTKGFNGLKNPMNEQNREIISPLSSVGCIIAMLGFFESLTASKSLGGLDNSTVSSNRELVALGMMNIVGSTFGVLPSFGGYGRSKINLISGGQTVISGVCMGVVSLLTVYFLLPAIHYIPICILSVITTMVGISLLEEAPADILFHIHCHGYNELIIFCITFLTTFFYSVEVGICIGCVYSIIRIIKHSAKSRIQIMAKMEGIDHFVNADDYVNFRSIVQHKSLPNLEHFEGCLVVKIPEPLTFTNTEDLKERLDRLERFGSTKTHPGCKGTSKDNVEYVIFDLHGMTYMDSSAAQILYEIITEYKKRDVVVLLARVPLNKEIRDRLQSSGVESLVEKDKVRRINNNHTRTTTKFSQTSYFPSIEEALFMIDCIKERNLRTHNLPRPTSQLSLTLINSSLV